MTQLSLDEGVRLKIQGLDALEDDHRFLDTMREAAIRISHESGFVTSDNLRVLADKLGLKPKHPNAWGALFRGPHWTIIGRQKSAVPGNRAREIKVWRYAP